MGDKGTAEPAASCFLSTEHKQIENMTSFGDLKRIPEEFHGRDPQLRDVVCTEDVRIKNGIVFLFIVVFSAIIITLVIY